MSANAGKFREWRNNQEKLNSQKKCQSENTVAAFKRAKFSKGMFFIVFSGYRFSQEKEYLDYLGKWLNKTCYRITWETQQGKEGH